MNPTTVISAVKPVAVTLGNFTLYCENFCAERTRLFSEQNTCSGNVVFSNTGKKAMKITLKGRVFSSELPTDFLIEADRLIDSSEELSFDYRGAFFTGCRLLSFSFEDKGEDLCFAAVTLITSEQTGNAPAEEVQ